MTTCGSSCRVSAATRNASNGVASADEYSAPTFPAALSNGTACTACDSIATTSTRPPRSRPRAASRDASDPASSSMSRWATGHGVTSPSTTIRPIPQTSGGSSYRFANVAMSALRHARDLVRRTLTEELLVGDELDVRLDADGPVDGLGDARAEVGRAAGAVGRVADAQAQAVDLTSRPDDLEQAGSGLGDGFDRRPQVAGQHRAPVHDDLVALPAQRPHAPVRPTACAPVVSDAHEVVGPVTHERRDLVEQRRRHQLAPLAVADRLDTVWIQGIEVAGVLPEVAAVVLAALGGRADVAHAGVHEQLEAPAVLDAPARPRPDRLARERDAPVAREGVGQVDARGRRVLLDRDHQRTGQVVPSGRAQLAAEADELRDVGGLVVDEEGRRADAADRVVDAGAAEREQAVRERVAGPATELPELAHEHARPAPGVGRRRRVTGGPGRGEDRAEHLGHLRIEAQHAAVRIAVTVPERPNRVLVDEGHPLVELIHRLDVVGRDAGRVPRLADQRRPLVGPWEQVAEEALLPDPGDLVARHRLDLGREVATLPATHARHRSRAANFE